jgi:hypothetical protein
VDVDSVRLEIGQHELQFVDQLLLKDQVLRPDRWLVVGEKVRSLKWSETGVSAFCSSPR